MNWFYVALAFMSSIPFIMVLMPFPIGGFIYLIGNPTALLIWNWAECEPQRKLLKESFANRYEKRLLILPIIATFLLTMVWLIVCNVLLLSLRIAN